MENTGERHITDEVFFNEADLFNHYMHLATYKFAEKYIDGKSVLDYGCGSGYGSHLLSAMAKQVKGVDISNEAIEYAKNKYHSTNLEYCLISDLKEEEKFDVIVSFQVIEHIKNGKLYISKLKSLLKPDGYLLISTPDKAYRLYRGIQKSWNIYHLKEYSEKSLKRLLTDNFNHVEILKIGSQNEFAKYEIIRCKRQRNIALACTLFLYPEFLRVALLNLQSKLYKSIKKSKIQNETNELTSNQSDNHIMQKYSIEDIEISHNPNYTADLLAICHYK